MTTAKCPWWFQRRIPAATPWGTKVIPPRRLGRLSLMWFHRAEPRPVLTNWGHCLQLRWGHWSLSYFTGPTA